MKYGYHHLALVALFAASSSMAQGPLAPPGAPSPTMKTLQQVEPRIPITNVPFVISQPGSYYLTGNMQSSDSGVAITTSDVTLDLMGFRLGGSGGAFSGVALSPPDTNSLRNIIVRNGSIVGFQDGVRAGQSIGARFEQLTISVNLDHGIHFAARTRGHVVSDCMIVENGDDGIYLYGAFGTGYADGHRIQRTTIARNGRHGIHAYAQFGGRVNGNRFEDISIEGNTDRGIMLDGAGGACNDNAVLRSSVTANGEHGIFLNGESGSCDGNRFEDVTVSGNGALTSPSYGFYLVGESGSCSANKIDGCTIRANGNYGIYLLGQCVGNTITKTSVHDHTGYGIYLRSREASLDGNRITDCTISGNGGRGLIVLADGGTADANVITDNSVVRNNSGILFKAEAGGILSANQIARNAVSRNTSQGGISLRGDGGMVIGNHVYRNTASYNSGAGIGLTTSTADDSIVRANLVERNIATHNGPFGIHLFGGPFIIHFVDENRVENNLTAGQEFGIAVESFASRRNLVVQNQSADGVHLVFGSDATNPHGPIVSHSALLGNSGEQAHPWANFAPVTD